jgi:2-amino-4-hydroxy-6-hydroxymethyldihydropteridine diphosphokinase
MQAAKTIYLALGSNAGERRRHHERALEALAAAGVRVLRRSSFYQSEPVGIAATGWFLNAVVKAETALLPRQLLRAVQQIERQLGRRARAPGSPPERRTVDIDILLYGASVVRTPELVIPHPRMTERRFVLAPLCEIAPSLRHPVLGSTVAELLAALTDRPAVRRLR